MAFMFYCLYVSMDASSAGADFVSGLEFSNRISMRFDISPVVQENSG